MKSQGVRLLDIFVLGPYLIYLSRKLSPPHNTLLLISGIATIGYNLRNYLKIDASDLKKSSNPKIAIKKDQRLWKRAVYLARQKQKGKNKGRHSARAMQMAVQIYKKMGGRFQGSKGASLKTWQKEKWTTKTGIPARLESKKGTSRYLPKKVWKKLKPSEARATILKKIKSKKQYVPNTKKTRAVKKRLR